MILFVTIVALTTLPFSSGISAAPDTTNSLRIYFIDVEGGQATLFITPEGQSLLIDTGWPGNPGIDSGPLVAPSASANAKPSDPQPTARDAGRIVAAAKEVGLAKIDYVLITHYHMDHVGGVAQLAERIPIGTFIDHGENSEPDGEFTKPFYAAYQKLLASGKYQHIAVKPGDVLPIKGMRAEIVSSDGAVLREALPGAGQPNPACQDFNPPADKTENAHSVGTLITFGKLRIVDLGDLTADKEKEMMCPIDRLGHVDIYIASHHGNEQSGSAALVHAIAPHVAIVDNGARKGGSPWALQIMKTSPKPKDLWQLHYSEEATVNNTTPEFIANLQSPDSAHYLKLTANPDGTFTVFNSRTKETKRYSIAR